MTISEQIQQFLNSKDYTSYLYNSYFLDHGDTVNYKKKLDNKELNHMSLFLNNRDILDFEHSDEWEFVPTYVENGINYQGMIELAQLINLLNQLYD